MKANTKEILPNGTKILSDTFPSVLARAPHNLMIMTT
jgi:hypothetical protein